MELTAWIPLLSLALAAATFFIGRMTAKKAEGEESGTIKTDIAYIKKSVEGIERRMEQSATRTDDRLEEQGQQLTGIGERLSKVEESAKSAHKRLDEHVSNHNK